MSRLAAALAFALLWIGCAKSAQHYGAPAPVESAPYAYADGFGGPDEAPASESFDARAFDGPPPPPPEAEPAAASQEAPAAARRMVHYNGWAELRVTKPEALIDEVAALAEGAGGYVERRGLRSITARVPVEAFEETFAACLALGEVLSRSLTAADVTDAFTAADLRLATARSTRARLVELLAKAEDEAEKIALLKEIQRVSEEIDLLESRLRTLGSMAAYSRLTIEASGRSGQASRSGEELAGLGFISDLSPFRRDVAHSGRPLRLDTPEGLVALTRRGPYAAEGAGGAALWSGRIRNEPRGDAAWWIDAIERRLAPEFGGAEVSASGGWVTLRLVEPGAEAPYRYVIAIRDRGKWLELIEAYYPDAEAVGG